MTKRRFTMSQITVIRRFAEENPTYSIAQIASKWHSTADCIRKVLGEKHTSRKSLQWRGISVDDHGRPISVFDALALVNHDEDFEARNTHEFTQSAHGPGTPEKVEDLRRRVELGQPLWHPHDQTCFQDAAGGSGSSTGIRYLVHPMGGKGVGAS